MGWALHCMPPLTRYKTIRGVSYLRYYNDTKNKPFQYRAKAIAKASFRESFPFPFVSGRRKGGGGRGRERGKH